MGWILRHQHHRGWRRKSCNSCLLYHQAFFQQYNEGVLIARKGCNIHHGSFYSLTESYRYEHVGLRSSELFDSVGPGKQEERTRTLQTASERLDVEPRWWIILRERGKKFEWRKAMVYWLLNVLHSLHVWSLLQALLQTRIEKTHRPQIRPTPAHDIFALKLFMTRPLW